ncbi:helix-turn-helix transcriptional regulator [Plastoroseomonas hellenica]|uniref:helix-turn-helix transcriptional regulator n=1 Tax=Plastoroseomonas hellenica TaxID=2687306 RepID=UPI001BA69150|nr:LuxR C-terminal-related transcriptional regulator [Plastoroseomonas hellenica]MBR0641629.1 helix-turn-helix transcriptional regulator [Plastoroseomonas hellenica]
MILRSSRGATPLDAIYAAAAQPERWPETLTRVADHLGATGGMIAYVAPRGRQSFLVTGRLREDLGALFIERYLQNPWTIAMAGVPIGKPVTVNSLIDTGALRRTAFHADILAPQGIETNLNVKEAVFGGGGGLGGFGFTLSPRGAEQAGERLRRFGRLVPHLSRALETSLTLGRYADGARQLARVLQLMPGPALLLDRAGRISHANPAAEALLRQRDGLTTDREGGLRLAAALPAETGSLMRAVTEALSIAAGSDTALRPPLRLTRPSGRPPLLVILVPLPPPAFALWELTEAARALVLVIDPAPQPLAAAEAAGAAFGLTAAEARVAALIAGGLSGPQAAAVLGISPTTLKTHLLRCFDKTGVRSQAGLMRLLGALPSGPEPFFHGKG